MPGEQLTHLPHLRLERLGSAPYQSPRGGGGDEVEIPLRNPQEHAAALLAQIDALQAQVGETPPEARPTQAQGHLVSADAAAGFALAIDSLGDRPTDVAVVAASDDRSTAVLHLRKDDLKALRRKVEQYADPDKATKTGKRRNQPLLAPLESLRPATIEDLSQGTFTNETIDPHLSYWVEVWTQGGRLADPETRERVAAAIGALAQGAEIDASKVHRFTATEREIFLLPLPGGVLVQLPQLAPDAYRVRAASGGLLDVAAHAGVADLDLQAMAEPPEPSASTVVIMDTGIAETHPLLAAAMAGGSDSVVVGKPDPTDEQGHGTEMAGVAAYRTLSAELLGGVSVQPRVWLQNIRLLDFNQDNDDEREFWPERTERAVIAAGDAQQRKIFNLSIGASNPDPGRTTSWSVAMDTLAFNEGAGRLFVVAAGSVMPSILRSDYPNWNLTAPLHDPGHALNVLTVGAVTHRVEVPQDGIHDGLVALATEGQLSPHSACDLGGTRPIKPEVVVEGGNCAPDGSLQGLGVPSLSLLTTSKDHSSGSPLTITWATSPAAANVSGMLGTIWEANPARRPETIRGLLVHSARWSPEMHAQFEDKRDRLRAVGYGEPDEERAAWSARTRPTLLVEDRLAPRIANATGFERPVHLYRLPLPSDELLALGETDVEVSVTLSFLIEPNEANSRYAGAMLRWDMQGPVEAAEDFEKRINKLARPEGHTTQTSSYPWEIGSDTRSRGSVQADRCRTSAANLAGDRLIAVFPTLGWWEDRNERLEAELEYSLVVTVDAGDAEIDLYNLVENAISVLIPAS